MLRYTTHGDRVGRGDPPVPGVGQAFRERHDRADARRVASELRDLDVYFFEEPLPPEDLAGYATLEVDSDVPRAGGESWAFLDEFDRTPNPFRDDLVQKPIENEGMSVPVPDRPGIGITIDPDTIERFRID